MRIKPYLFLVCLVLGLRTPGEAELPPAAVQADALLRNQALTPAFAAKPEHESVVRAVRMLAKNGDSRARLALLKIADPETVETSLKQMRSHHWAQSGEAAVELGASGQPVLILALSEDLLKQESAAPANFVSGDEHFKVRPRSVLAAKAIRDIIVNAPEFNEALKAWARQLDSGADRNFELGREGIRAWWKQNQGLLRDGKYRAAHPPR
ncbi:MAG: hypothetical protein QOD80_413 [Verrucomicrobiota bacterium]|jgi:hypothetical protein